MLINDRGDDGHHDHARRRAVRNETQRSVCSVGSEQRTKSVSTR